MVTSHQDDDSRVVVIKPNHSATWRNNLYALIKVAIPSLGAVIGFTLLGAWPILPFAGAELIALFAALYYVNWKLEYRHVLTLKLDEVKIDKGYFAPKRTWTWPREQASVNIIEARHDWEAQSVSLNSRDALVTIVEFLNKEDMQELI